MSVSTPPVTQSTTRPPTPTTAPPTWAAPTSVTPTALRRRPALLVLGLCLTALGGVVAAWIYTAISNTETIVAVRAPIERGALLTAEDLTTTQIGGDPELDTIPGDQLPTLVGQRAAVDLPAGGIVTTTSVTDTVVPSQGQSVVGLTLTRAQLPAAPLLVGDAIRLVATPRAQDDPPEQPPTEQAATVQGVTPVEATGEIVVDVLVTDTEASSLAAQAATGRIALILDSREP